MVVDWGWVAGLVWATDLSCVVSHVGSVCQSVVSVTDCVVERFATVEPFATVELFATVLSAEEVDSVPSGEASITAIRTASYVLPGSMEMSEALTTPEARRRPSGSSTVCRLQKQAENHQHDKQRAQDFCVYSHRITSLSNIVSHHSKIAARKRCFQTFSIHESKQFCNMLKKNNLNFSVQIILFHYICIAKPFLSAS